MSKKKHIRNHRNCPACCCKQIYRHSGCGGKFHETLVDDTIDDGFIHNYRCDKCDLEDYRDGYESYKIEFEKSKGEE